MLYIHSKKLNPSEDLMLGSSFRTASQGGGHYLRPSLLDLPSAKERQIIRAAASSAQASQSDGRHMPATLGMGFGGGLEADCSKEAYSYNYTPPDAVVSSTNGPQSVEEQSLHELSSGVASSGGFGASLQQLSTQWNEDCYGAGAAIDHAVARRAVVKVRTAAAYAAYAEAKAELAYREAHFAASVKDRMLGEPGVQHCGRWHDPSSDTATTRFALGDCEAFGGVGDRRLGGGMLPPHSSGTAVENDLCRSPSTSRSLVEHLSSLSGSKTGVLPSHWNAHDNIWKNEVDRAMPRPVDNQNCLDVNETSATPIPSSFTPSTGMNNLRKSFDATAAVASSSTLEQQKNEKTTLTGKKRGRKPKVCCPAIDGQDEHQRKHRRRIEKRKKRKDRPKRPLSAYNIYFREERAKILDSIPTRPGFGDDSNGDEFIDKNYHLRDQVSMNLDAPKPLACLGGEPRSLRLSRPHGKITFQELAKIIGRNWREMREEQRSHYKRMATQDMQRYKDEMESWQNNVKFGTA